MTPEEKELLLKVLCAMLPYGVKCDRFYNVYQLVDIDIKRELIYLLRDGTYVPYSLARGDEVKPYLRPISSMTEEERAEMGKAIQKDRIEPYGEIKNFGEDNLLLCTIRQSTNLQDWLNAHHFDYQGLIPMGLALEAPEGMYKHE